jgi:hypothetical protein
MISSQKLWPVDHEAGRLRKTVAACIFNNFLSPYGVWTFSYNVHNNLPLVLFMNSVNPLLGLLAPEDGTDMLSRNDSKELPLQEGAVLNVNPPHNRKCHFHMIHLILFSHLRLDLPSDLVASGTAPKIWYEFFHLHACYLSCHIILILSSF